MRLRRADWSGVLLPLSASVVVHAAAIAALAEALDRDRAQAERAVVQVDLRDADLRLPGGDFPLGLGDLDTASWSDLADEASLRTARSGVPDCQWGNQPRSACYYGPYPLECVGVPWTIGIGGGASPETWAHSSHDDAWLVTLVPVDPESNAKVTQVQAPAYPADALAAGLRGSVSLAAEVDADGRATRVSVERSSGHRTLDDAAVAAAEGWSWCVEGPGPWVGRVIVRFRSARRAPSTSSR